MTTTIALLPCRAGAIVTSTLFSSIDNALGSAPKIVKFCLPAQEAILQISSLDQQTVAFGGDGVGALRPGIRRQASALRLDIFDRIDCGITRFHTSSGKCVQAWVSISGYRYPASRLSPIRP